MKNRLIWVFVTGFLIITSALRTHALEPVGLASPGTGTSFTGGGGSFAPKFSSDGNKIAFVSHANNLVTNDSQFRNLDLFVWDINDQSMILMSGGRTNDILNPGISSDGNIAVYEDLELHPVDAFYSYQTREVFVKNSASNTTLIASVNTNNALSQGFYRGLNTPFVSDNGRYVYFQSTMPDLIEQPPDYYNYNFRFVYVRDLQENKTRLASPYVSFSSSPIKDIQLVTITPDGNRVAFIGVGLEFLPGIIPTQRHLFVWDATNNTTYWASTNLTNFMSSDVMACTDAAFSAGGRYLAFKTFACTPCSNSVFSLFRHDLTTASTLLISTNLTEFSTYAISEDGRYVAYDDGTNIFRWDAMGSFCPQVDVGPGGSNALGGISCNVAMTPNGRFLAFVSSATNLTANLPDGTFQIYWRDMDLSSATLVSENLFGKPGNANHELCQPCLSGNGRWVAFDSEATDLVTNDLNNASDVFVRDMESNKTILVSRRDPSLPCLTGTSFNTLVSNHGLSDDGSKILVISPDTQLVPGSSNRLQRVFVRDLNTGTCQFTGLDLTQATDLMLSGDGRFLVYTVVSNYGIASQTTYGPVCRKNLQDSTVEIISVSWNGDTIAGATAADVSSDGQSVLFLTKSSNVVLEATGSVTNVYLRDVAQATNILISTDVKTDVGTQNFWGARLSPNGRFVAFMIYIYSESYGGLLMRDLTNKTTTNLLFYAYPSYEFSPDSSFIAAPLCERFSQPFHYDLYKIKLPSFEYASLGLCSESKPSLSTNAGRIAYKLYPDNNSPANVYVWDNSMQTSNNISLNTNGISTTGLCDYPLITPDGRCVFFASLATDLVPNDTNSVPDYFMRDLTTGKTMAISKSWRTSATGSGPSAPATINRSAQAPCRLPLLTGLHQLSRDGRTYVFSSFAGDLVPGDYNDQRDIFVLRLNFGDSDHDGMDDDWEMAYFGTLARDGTGDFDSDGAKDLDEFRAGTDPTNTGSILKAMTLRPLGGATTTVIWPLTFGKTYKVEYKTNINDSDWTPVTGSITINGDSASIVDTTSGTARRFYRILVE